MLSLVSKEEHHEKKKTQKSRKVVEEPEISLAASKGISGTIVGQAAFDILSLLLGTFHHS